MPETKERFILTEEKMNNVVDSLVEVTNLMAERTKESYRTYVFIIIGFYLREIGMGNFEFRRNNMLGEHFFEHIILGKLDSVTKNMAVLEKPMEAHIRMMKMLMTRLI